MDTKINIFKLNSYINFYIIWYYYILIYEKSYGIPIIYRVWSFRDVQGSGDVSILAAMYNAYRQNSNAVKYLPNRTHLKCLTPFGIPPHRRITKWDMD